MSSPNNCFISILILTHNAPWYTFLTLSSLNKCTPKNLQYEVIVLDNNSSLAWRILLLLWQALGYIDRLLLIPFNSFFADGNNLAAHLSSPKVSHLLLLNSDVEIRSGDWIVRLLALHKRGISSLGVVEDSIQSRADGYCFLIDRDLYFEFGGLDSDFKWWWAITRLQSRVLNAGLPVQAVRKHDHLLHHFGGRSGPISRYLSPKDSGAQIDPNEVREWFGERSIVVIDTV